MPTDQEKREHKKRKAPDGRDGEKAKELQKRLDSIPEARNCSRFSTLGEFVWPYSFDNALPEVPCDPKLLLHTFDKDAFVRYQYDSSLEMTHKYDILAEPDLGISIDLVDPTAYDPTGSVGKMADEDAELLKLATTSDHRQGVSSARSKQMRNEVTWLRKTPILGNNLYEAVHNHPKGADHIERQHVATKGIDDTTVTLPKEQETLQEQIDSVEKSFDDAAALDLAKLGVSTGLQHPSNPALTPEAVLPLLPDLGCWANTYVQMQFDADPSLEQARERDGNQYPHERIANAIVKGSTTQEENGKAPQTFVAYLLPNGKCSADTLDDEEAADPGSTHFEWVREYAYEVKRESDGGSYFFITKEGGVEYNEVSTKMALTRKTFRAMSARPSEILLRRRKSTQDEEGEQSERRQRLLSRLLLDYTPTGAEREAAASAQQAAA